MSLLISPYNPSMKLGSGFNSYTQQLCIDHAVVRDETAVKYPADDNSLMKATAQVAQSVTFKTQVIEKLSDLTDVLNINGTLTVKAANIANANGTGSFIDSNKIKTSDLNFLITCKVVNQTVMEENLVRFMPLPNMKPENFTDIYGDSFISGFQIGGEFNALISIKVRDQAQINEISAKATLAFTTPGFTDKSSNMPADTAADETKKTDSKAAAASGGSGLSITADAQIAKTRNDVMSENEVTISVSWTGGGQDLKSPTADWNFDTLRQAAIKFPELVAQTPVRTNAILTKYTALKTFYTSGPQSAPFEPLSYENAGIYTTMLQDAYLDYKNIYKELSLLGTDVDGGRKALIANVAAPKALPAATNTKAMNGDSPSTAKPTTADQSSGGATTGSTETDASRGTSEASKELTTTSSVAQPKAPVKETAIAKADNPGHSQPTAPAPKSYTIEKAYEPTIFGLEKAKRDVRFMMGRIVNEVDAVAKNPIIAVQEDREPPFMAPLMFKQYLPGTHTVAVV